MLTKRQLAGCLPLLFAAVSCGGGSPMPAGESGTSDGTDAGGENPADGQPCRGEWIVVVNQPFAWDDVKNPIRALRIGGMQRANNFASRGDVSVTFGDTGGNIIIEMRPFAHEDTKALTQVELDRLELWAYASAGQPEAPSAMAPEDDCVGAGLPWKNDCEVRVYYAGEVQPDGVGADLRVILPEGYRNLLEVVTEDNTATADYLNRGNVCVQNAAGSVDVKLASGQAFVSLAENIVIAPSCDQATLDECVANQWDANRCNCLEFGFVNVRGQNAEAVDITVDVPQQDPTFWAAVTMRNMGPQTQGDPAPGRACDATVDPGVGAYEVNAAIGGENGRDPWRNEGALNQPLNGVPGAGYGVTMTSDACRVVSQTEDPADFVGMDNADQQQITERGNLLLCSGCLRTQSCEDLLP